MKNLKTIFGGPLAMVFLIFTAYTGHAKEPVYPPLTGRVVDAANVIPENDEIGLTKKLKDFEESSGHQFAVATIPDLGDMAIAEYSIGLGRHWKIGRSDIDDGILLVLTPGNGQPGTLKVRLEVGRGMEYILTDAATNSIVRNDIIDTIRNAKTRADGIPKGIVAGVDATIRLGQITPEQKADFDRKEREVAAKRDQESWDAFVSFLTYGIMFLAVSAIAIGVYLFATRKKRAQRKAELEEKARADAEEYQKIRAERIAAMASQEQRLQEERRQALMRRQNMLDAMSPHDRREFLLKEEANERQRRERMEEQRRHERLLNEQREEENRRRREEQSRQNDISFGGWSSGGGSSSDDNWRSSNSGGDSFSGGGGGDFGGGGSEGSL